MALTDCLPWAGKIWEDLSKDEKEWAAWKNMYKASDRKAKVKKQAIGSQDQFGAAYGALRQASQAQQTNGQTRSEADLGEYFDALAEAATTKKGMLEDLVKANSAITTRSNELSASMSKLIKANK